MAQTYQTQGLGWLPGYPDYRDYTVETTEVNARRRRLNEKPVRKLLAQVGVTTATASVPGSVDLRQWFSAVDQGNLGSCTAHAGVGLVEYFERRAFGKHIDASRLFLTRSLATSCTGKGTPARFFVRRWVRGGGHLDLDADLSLSHQAFTFQTGLSSE